MDAALNPRELIDLLPKYFAISMIGVRNSGKSVMIQAMIKELIKAKRVDMVIVMSGSAKLNNDYSFLPESVVMEFNSDLLGKMWEKQVKLKEAGKAEHIFIVFDDVLANKEAIRNEYINKIWTQGRHVFFSSAILSQYPAYVCSPTILGNSDMILYSKMNRQSLEKLAYATTGLSIQEFIRISEQIAGVDYTFMCINNYCKDPDPLVYLNYARATI